MLRGHIAGVNGALARLAAAGGGVGAEVRAEVGRQTMSLLARAKQLVSGRVLRNVSSTLMRKLNASVESAPGREVGAVGIKLTYAAVHEFGFHGRVQVKEHSRRIGLRQELRAAKTAKGKTIMRKVDVHDRLARVKAHTRQMNMPERPYLRRALAERRDAIVAAIRAAAARGAAK